MNGNQKEPGVLITHIEECCLKKNEKKEEKRRPEGGRLMTVPLFYINYILNLASTVKLPELSIKGSFWQVMYKSVLVYYYHYYFYTALLLVVTR